MKVLITGGNGFIGRNLNEALAVDHEVVAKGRDALDLLDAAAVEEALKAGHFDAVVHAATYDAAPRHTTKDPARVLENNVRMFFNLVRCQRWFGKLIYFGSGAEFDRLHWVPRMTEAYFDEHVPADPYGFSKYLMTRTAMQSGGRIINLRLFGVIGRHDDWRTRFPANACCRVVSGLPIIMNRNRVFDHLWMDDLSRIVRWCLEKTPRYPVYNACSGEAAEFMTLASIIAAESGTHPEIIVKEEGLGPEYSGDNQRLAAELGAFQFTPVAEAVRQLYRWYKANTELIRREWL